VIFGKRVLILTPTALPSVTGNAVTAERWRRLLVERGAMVKVVSIENLKSLDIYRIIMGFNPDIIHGHHAVKTGRLFLDEYVAEVTHNIPIVISLPGTDINIGILEDRRIVEHTLNRASAIIYQSKKIGEIVEKEFPEVLTRLIFVPKSPMWFGDRYSGIRARAGCREDDILFFHPAGIRPVKANLECLECFKEVNRIRSKAKIVFAGPALDMDYARRFEECLRTCNGFATWIPAIPLEEMQSAYRYSDIILNTSISEGISTVLLEAVFSGKPVLASDIPGNRWFLTSPDNSRPSKQSPDSKAYTWAHTRPPIDSHLEDSHLEKLSGILYNPQDPKDFIKKAIALMDSKELRDKIAREAVLRRSCLPGLKDEAEGLLYAYRSAQGFF